MSTIDNIILSSTNAIALAGEVAEAVVQHDTAVQAGVQLRSDFATLMATQIPPLMATSNSPT
jgi:hypothetical protein